MLSLLYKLDELVGPEAIATAINTLDKADKRLRIKRVRYYGFDALGEALIKAEKSKKKRRALKRLFG